MTNGYSDKWDDRIRLVEQEASDMRASLTTSVDRLSESVNMLALEVRELAKNFRTAVPIKLVLVMFCIVIGALFGIETVKLLPKLLGI